MLTKLPEIPEDVKACLPKITKPLQHGKKIVEFYMKEAILMDSLEDGYIFQIQNLRLFKEQELLDIVNWKPAPIYEMVKDDILMAEPDDFEAGDILLTGVRNLFKDGLICDVQYTVLVQSITNRFAAALSRNAPTVLHDPLNILMRRFVLDKMTNQRIAQKKRDMKTESKKTSKRK